jgi:hypothetical protein
MYITKYLNLLLYVMIDSMFVWINIKEYTFDSSNEENS